MGTDMYLAAIAVSVQRTEPPDFHKGRLLIGSIDDVTQFTFGDTDDVESAIRNLLPDLDPASDVLDPNGQPLLELARRACLSIVDDLEEALASRETASIVVAGYRLYVSGGLSSGDSPTDAAEKIWNASQLPIPVLREMGFVPDCGELSLRNSGSQEYVTDTDIVDALALGLGTRTEWSSDDYEWIVNILSKVRPKPGYDPPLQYLDGYSRQYGFDPRTSEFLAQNLGEEVTEMTTESGTELS
ncbi:hypothetical protein [Amycolatopsis sp. TNS106]|uniref:hypothetical protein n=1 Tax=Amycolatopsis sp. TNS106 TaxID=2861750 RepID=UPI001C5A5402|nr:hypothetical protein [Amycolatopsis sp. TNS106]QXV57392.1 hypothetical protein CVV72_10460 [Amycolatopsis sp. TNS106]